MRGAGQIHTDVEIHSILCMPVAEGDNNIGRIEDSLVEERGSRKERAPLPTDRRGGAGFF